MKIISKYNDYYDCIQAYGFDDSCLYIRKKEDIKIHMMDYPAMRDLEQWGRLNATTTEVGRWLNITTSVLFYCGEIYPHIEISTHQATRLSSSVEEFEKNLEYFNDYDNIIKYNYERYHSKLDTFDYQFGRFNKQSVKEFFELKLDVEDLFFDNECPLLYVKLPNRYYWRQNEYSHLKFIKNPSLSDLNFYHNKSEYEAFTDIRNYITQQLGGNSPKMVDISNTDKILKQGFDLKTSFRKAPSKKNKRKKQK